MLFLAKLYNDDRDNVLYIEDDIFEFECGHYFGSLRVGGSCFTRRLEAEDLDNIKHSLLTEEELERLYKAGEEIENLGYSIKESPKDDRYKKGLSIRDSIKDIMDKLKSPENEEYFEKNVFPEEMERFKEKGLTTGEVWDVLRNYPLEYKDASIVGYVYGSSDEAGGDEAYNYGYVGEATGKALDAAPDKYISPNGKFDYEEFAWDLIRSESYYELDSGKVVSFMF